MYLNFLAIAAVLVFIIDISGSIEHLIHPVVKRILGMDKNKQIRIPLIECSLCTVFHTGWIYLLIIGQFTPLNFLFTSFVAFITPNIKGLFIWVKELLISLETLLYAIFIIK